MMEPQRGSPPIVLDAVLAVALLSLGLINSVEINNSDALTVFTRDPDALNLVLIAFMSLPLVLRRRFPLGVLGVTFAAFVVDRVLDYPQTLASIGIVLVIHAIGSEMPRRQSAMVGGALLVGMTAFTTLGALTLESITLGSIITTDVLVAAPLFLGREVHERRRRFEKLTRRAEDAEREREERARQAVVQERARIARELHDVVAHQMAVMTLQAEGASRLSADADPRVRTALDTIREAGHEALTEMRRMVGLLRTADDSTGELEPQPGLDHLDELVKQMRDAGLPVDVEVAGTPRPLPPGIGLNSYRIIQESLTNALKHGGNGTSATVVVAYEDDGLRLSVVDNGRGIASELANANSRADGHHGLVGMRERVALLSGEFTAGPRAGGGFALSAFLPEQS